MRDFTLDKGKGAILMAGLFCLVSVYSAVVEYKLPADAQAIEPAQKIIELDPVNIQLLTKTNLFGEPPQIKVAVKQNNAAAQAAAKAAAQKKQQTSQSAKKQQNTKPIKIKVTVTGLLASNDVDFSAAMLKIDNKPEKLFLVGEDLGKPEVKLQSVESESVVIDNNGNEQIIAMKRPGLESSNAGNKNNKNSRSIPEIPPELNLPGELEMLNSALFQGAATSESLEQYEIDDIPLPEELEEELLMEQLEEEMDESLLQERFMNETANLKNRTEEPPDFQLPVF